MFKNSIIFKSSGRQKTRWSLSTEHEQMELWELERQIFNHVACKIVLVRLKDPAFERIMLQWKGAA